jgi:hypothetical protein
MSRHEAILSEEPEGAAITFRIIKNLSNNSFADGFENGNASRWCRSEV